MLRIGDHDIFGAEVNAASKLGEDEAKAEEILVTDSLREAIGKKKGVRFRALDVVPPGAEGAFKVGYGTKQRKR